MRLVTGYYYDDSFRLWLSTSDGDIALEGTLDIPLSRERYCTGYWKDGEQHDCPKNAKVSRGRACNSCAALDEFSACLKCEGDECAQGNAELKHGCAEPKYSVYLAAFGPWAKVGVSRTERLLKRWVEQGADSAVEILRGLDGFRARTIESELVSAGLIDRLTAERKISVLGKSCEGALAKAYESPAVQNSLERHGEQRIAFEETTLSKYYGETECDGVTEILSGRVAGQKGPLLFLENKAYALGGALGRMVEKPLADYCRGII